MNYRHAFHAGNHADVLKHTVLALCLAYLNRKEKAWRFIDTHAGAGLYDLTAPEAERSPEWKDGIARLVGHGLDAGADAALADYLRTVAAANPAGGLTRYPGSPAVARALARRQDRLTLVELHPQDFKKLDALYAGDIQVKCIALDGWLALGGFVPPKERRGLVLIDPPFEQPGEFERLADGLAKAHKRWADGIYLLWYPLKDTGAVERFCARIAAWGEAPALRAELHVRRPTGETFDGSGLICVNPPFVLEDELARALPPLARRLAQDKGAGYKLDWLTAAP